MESAVHYTTPEMTEYKLVVVGGEPFKLIQKNSKKLILEQVAHKNISII